MQHAANKLQLWEQKYIKIFFVLYRNRKSKEHQHYIVQGTPERKMLVVVVGNKQYTLEN